jgi:hypothetical protein
MTALPDRHAAESEAPKCRYIEAAPSSHQEGSEVEWEAISVRV